MPLNIAILASGRGTNAQAMFDKAAAGVLDVNIRRVVSNRPGAKVVSARGQGRRALPDPGPHQLPRPREL